MLEKAKLAVDFSRAMYELDPITEFPEDPVLSSVEDGSPRVLQPPDFEVCSGGAEVVARRVVACCVAVPNMLEPLHVDALEAMIATLSGNGGGGVDDGKGRLAAVPPPFWVDVVAAHSYQSVLKRVLAVSSTAAAEFGGIEPRHVFDGFLFHTVLNAARTVSGPLPRPDISCLDNKSVDSDAATDDGDDLAQGALPIDAHRETILAHIAAHRVTVIVGETGCGKSSRLPVMLLQSGGSAKRPVKMFCSQPRRIAAKALCNRVRTTPGFAGLVGMRMGHGEKDESRGTRIWFVTTGYLVRLIAHHPEVLQDHTHLIIDEVHER